MFAQVIIRVFDLVYCRAPNKKDAQWLTKMNEKRGSPDKLGSVDFKHWSGGGRIFQRRSNHYFLHTRLLGNYVFKTNFDH
jgi:hypothetical protein